MDWQTLLGLLLLIVGGYSFYDSIVDWTHGVNMRSAPVGTIGGFLIFIFGLDLLGLI